jgi:hypothetical protein
MPLYGGLLTVIVQDPAPAGDILAVVFTAVIPPLNPMEYRSFSESDFGVVIVVPKPPLNVTKRSGANLVVLRINSFRENTPVL